MCRANRSTIGALVATTAAAGGYRPAAGRDDDLAVVTLFEAFDDRVAVEAAAFCLDGGDKPRRYLSG